MTEITAEHLTIMESRKRRIFKRALKTRREGAKVTCWGRLFQVWVAATGNVCRSYDKISSVLFSPDTKQHCCC